MTCHRRLGSAHLQVGQGAVVVLLQLSHPAQPLRRHPQDAELAVILAQVHDSRNLVVDLLLIQGHQLCGAVIARGCGDVRCKCVAGGQACSNEAVVMLAALVVQALRNAASWWC